MRKEIFVFINIFIFCVFILRIWRNWGHRRFRFRITQYIRKTKIKTSTF